MRSPGSTHEDNSSIIEDDGGLSSDITVIENSHDGNRQALWIGVRPVYYAGEPSAEPMIEICYQNQYMSSDLHGPVWITPGTWRELVRAVNGRLDKRASLRRKFRGFLPKGIW